MGSDWAGMRPARAFSRTMGTAGLQSNITYIYILYWNTRSRGARKIGREGERGRERERERESEREGGRGRGRESFMEGTQVSAGVVGLGIETENWSNVYLGYFTVHR